MKTTASHFLESPHTRIGRWAAGLGVAFIILFLLNGAVFMQPTFNPPWAHTVMPFYGLLMLLCGLGAGASSLIAVINRHERSWVLWLMILPGVLMLFLIVGEFIYPH